MRKLRGIFKINTKGIGKKDYKLASTSARSRIEGNLTVKTKFKWKKLPKVRKLKLKNKRLFNVI